MSGGPSPHSSCMCGLLMTVSQRTLIALVIPSGGARSAPESRDSRHDQGSATMYKGRGHDLALDLFALLRGGRVPRPTLGMTSGYRRA